MQTRREASNFPGQNQIYANFDSDDEDGPEHDVSLNLQQRQSKTFDQIQKGLEVGQTVIETKDDDVSNVNAGIVMRSRTNLTMSDC